jgi:two-component system, NtrC family, nitrogen regulation sensor histidine kinase NtrY
VLWLAIGTFLVFAVAISQTAFNLKFIHADSNTLGYAALSGLIFLLLLAMTFVLLRNVLKLYGDRRLGVPGSKFRARMVLMVLLLSLLPVIAQFSFARLLLNRSIDKWFSRPIEEVRKDTQTIASLMLGYAGQNAQSEATSIAAAPEVRRAFASGDFSGVQSEFRRHEPTLQGGFVVALIDGEMKAGQKIPGSWPLQNLKIPSPMDAVPGPAHFILGQSEYILAAAPAGEHGLVLVGMPLPQEFSNAVRQLDQSEQRYVELSRERKLLSRTYMSQLLLITTLVLFAAMWLAVFLAKLVTRPVEALGEAMQAVSRGELNYRVDVSATDELGDLVRSFNRMAGELESSRAQIELAGRELADANSALERRRHYIETLVESIPTGVVSLEAQGTIRHANQAFVRMLRPEIGDTLLATSSPVDSVQVEAAPGTLLPSLHGAMLEDILPAEAMEEIAPLTRRAERMGTASAQMEFSVARRTLTVAVTVATLDYQGQRLGYVLVFEDLSDLLQAQKQAAWREVARRVAHEIKNPLTPIALSAERIRRQLERGIPLDAAAVAAIRSGSETISSSVETVRTLVDEFATVARFPTARPVPSETGQIIASALALFDGRLQGTRIRSAVAPDLPRVMADPEALKRALANLIDNAAEAMKDSLVREIHLSADLVPSRDAIEIIVADTGHGVSREAKEKLFLPYFSTKQRGTGLGLSIVSRIVEDHRGSIRVEENAPVGARFIIELPVATEIPLAPNIAALPVHAQHTDR